MGKSAARKSEDIQARAADRFTTLAENLNKESTPQRKQVGDYYSAIVKGGPEAFKVAAPQVEFVKRQFANARKQVQNYLHRGGAVDRGYKEVANAEAGAVGSIFTSKIQEALDRLQNLATSGTSGTISANTGAVGAGDSLAQLSAARANAVAGGLGGIAGAAGTFFGMRGA